MNSQNKSRTYRVVAPLWYWKEIFRKADLPHFLLHAGVRMMRGLLKDPDYVIYFVRSRGLDPVDWKEVGKTWVEIKTVEVGRNYMESMRRFQLLQPHFAQGQKTYWERERVVRGLLDGWIELMTMTSAAHFQGGDALSPWYKWSPACMPVVCWIRRQEQGGGECP